MSSGELTVQSTAPIAGIPIVHELAESIALEENERPGWEGAASAEGAPGGEPPVVVRHLLRDYEPAALAPTFSVEARIHYVPRADGRVEVHLVDTDDPSRSRLLRTEVVGERYVVEYGAPPSGRVIRRQVEMLAYTLALGSRGWGVMAHGCGAVLPGGGAALLLGHSGAGKSTVGRMLSSQSGTTVLNDDRIIVTPPRDGDGFRAWSTPWPGRAGIARPGDGPLAVIALIGRGERLAWRRLRATEALARLMTTIVVPLWDRGELAGGLAAIDELINTVPVIELQYPLGDATPGWIVETLSEVG